MSYMIFKQLPVFPPDAYGKDGPWDSGQRLSDWITYHVLELSYTTHDMAAFAADHGDKGPPFRWDEDRRFWLRAELDAAYFHLYGLPRDDVDYVLDTFRSYRRHDEQVRRTPPSRRREDRLTARGDPVMGQRRCRTPHTQNGTDPMPARAGPCVNL
ncbi:MAG: hypothetical protein ACRDRW_13355 [Pseudonocardiaceae bacterium]